MQVARRTRKQSQSLTVARANVSPVQTDRKQEASVCSGEWLVALVKLRAMDSAPAGTARSVNKFDAFSDRAPSCARPAQFLMFERPPVSVASLLSRSSLFHRHRRRRRAALNRRTRIHL